MITDKQLSSEKILLAAKELFEEQGFDHTSVREIANRAGVNVALINYHFGSKENLFLSVMEVAVEATRVKINDISVSAATPKEKLCQVIDTYVEKIFTNYKYHILIHREITLAQRAAMVEGITKILNRNVQVLRKVLEEGQKKKVFRKDADLELSMGVMFGLIHQSTNALYRGRYQRANESDDDFKARVKAFLQDILFAYLIKK